MIMNNRECTLLIRTLSLSLSLSFTFTIYSYSYSYSCWYGWIAILKKKKLLKIFLDQSLSQSWVLQAGALFCNFRRENCDIDGWKQSKTNVYNLSLIIKVACLWILMYIPLFIFKSNDLRLFFFWLFLWIYPFFRSWKRK